MTTPLNKLADKWRKDAYGPRDDIEVNSHYESGYEDAKRECANEHETALTAHNQRWLDLADELEREALAEVPPEYADRGLHRKYLNCDNWAGGMNDAAERIEQLAKEMGSE